MKIEIVKEYSEDLLEAMNRLIPQLTNSVKNIKAESVKELLATENAYLFVIREDSSKIVGTLTLAVFTTPVAKKAYIEDVVVDGACQGSGIGRKLVETAVSYARELGVARIELSSTPVRVAANKLYQSIGFKIRETNFYRLEL